jgi:hypothetical protein
MRMPLHLSVLALAVSPLATMQADDGKHTRPGGLKPPIASVSRPAHVDRGRVLAPGARSVGPVTVTQSAILDASHHPTSRRNSLSRHLEAEGE